MGHMEGHAVGLGAGCWVRVCVHSTRPAGDPITYSVGVASVPSAVGAGLLSLLAACSVHRRFPYELSMNPQVHRCVKDPDKHTHECPLRDAQQRTQL